MRHLLLGLSLLLLASPAFAQPSGDCLAETGTSTTWHWTFVQVDVGELCMDFYALGLRNVDQLCRQEKFAPGTDVIALANSKCQAFDDLRLEIEISAAMGLVVRNPDAELVTPAYPELCAAPPVTPDNPVKSAADHCRTAVFHQALIRASWPNDAQVLRDQFWDVWDWVDQTGPTGPGFNTGQKQGWLAVTSAEWSNAVNQRMNNMAAFVTSFDQDQQWIGELEDFN